MRAVVAVVVIAIFAGFIFWDDLFTEEEAADAIIIDEEPAALEEESGGEPAPQSQPTPPSDFQALIRAERWEEALNLLENRSGLAALHARHICLMRLGRLEESEKVMHELIDKAPASREAVLAALDSVEGGGLAPQERRLRLSRVADGFSQLDGKGVQRLVAAVREINKQLPASIKEIIEADKHMVVPNDCLWNICKKYNKVKEVYLESGLLCLLNGIKNERIYPGQALTIPKESLTIKVWRENWLLATFLGNVLFSVYPVGLGVEGSTPLGDFVVKTRLKNPDWYSEKHGKLIPFGDEQNILGTRWLGFENKENARGLGIHGTKDPDSIGKNLSSGCIRLANEDVEELFEIVPRGTSVKVF